MVLSVGYSLAIVAVVAVCTFITRLIPFAFFSGRKPPDLVLYLGKILPAAVIAILVVYCFREVSPAAYPHGIPEALACLAVVLIHLWKRNNLLSIGGGTLIYMVLVQLVFVV